MNEQAIPQEVKWRGSTYQLVEVEDGKVNWFNPVSRFKGSCSLDAWLKADPYEALSR